MEPKQRQVQQAVAKQLNSEVEKRWPKVWKSKVKQIHFLVLLKEVSEGQVVPVQLWTKNRQED